MINDQNLRECLDCRFIGGANDGGRAMAARDIETRYMLDTREYFSNIGIWPSMPMEVDTEGWLSNFTRGADRNLAADLLDSFLIISTKQCLTMVASAFHALSTTRGDFFEMAGDDYAAAWQEFRESVIVSFPASRSDPGGSGHLFVRHLRTLVHDPVRQILESAAAVQEISTSPDPRSIVFVDDFSGSGNQFLETWETKFALSSGEDASFASLTAAGKIEEAFFIPAIATWRAKQRILESAPSVQIRAAHVLPPRYSAREDPTSLVSPGARDALHELLRRYSVDAGYTEGGRWGYEDCALALSFEHKTPDNTLPIFNGGPERPASWKPLRSQ